MVTFYVPSTSPHILAHCPTNTAVRNQRSPQTASPTERSAETPPKTGARETESVVCVLVWVVVHVGGVWPSTWRPERKEKHLAQLQSRVKDLQENYDAVLSEQEQLKTLLDFEIEKLLLMRLQEM